MPRERKYDWDKWFAYDELELVEGDDYNCTSQSMGLMFRRQAPVYHKTVSIDTLDWGIRVTIKDKQ